MKTVHTRSHVGTSGQIHLSLQAAEMANRDVDIVVLIRPRGLKTTHIPVGSSHISDEEWAKIVKRSVGEGITIHDARVQHPESEGAPSEAT